MLKSNLKHSKKLKKSIVTSIQKDVEKKWSTERQTLTMEQPIPLGRMAFLSLWKDSGGIHTPGKHRVSPAIASLVGKDEGTSKSLHRYTPGAGHLPCSQVTRERDQQVLQPSATVPHQLKSLPR